MRASLTRTRRTRFDDYTLELQRHGMNRWEREVRWLNELIETERAGSTVHPAAVRDDNDNNQENGGRPGDRGTA